MSRPTKNRVVAYFTIFLVSGLSANAAEIELKSRTTSPGSLVLLGDLANITGSDATELEKLKRIELFPTPSRGDSRVVRRQELQELLRLNGVSLRAHTLTGAAVARVSANR